MSESSKTRNEDASTTGDQESTIKIGLDTEKSLGLGKLYHRRSLVRMEDRRFANASISHDGDYSFAICHAFDEPLEHNSEPLTDHGYGDPIHEPEYGDTGFGIP